MGQTSSPTPKDHDINSPLACLTASATSTGTASERRQPSTAVSHCFQLRLQPLPSCRPQVPCPWRVGTLSWKVPATRRDVDSVIRRVPERALKTFDTLPSSYQYCTRYVASSNVPIRMLSRRGSLHRLECETLVGRCPHTSGVERESRALHSHRQDLETSRCPHCPVQPPLCSFHPAPGACAGTEDHGGGDPRGRGFRMRRARCSWCFASLLVNGYAPAIHSIRCKWIPGAKGSLLPLP
jgi:hypothetical protein